MKLEWRLMRTVRRYFRALDRTRKKFTSSMWACAVLRMWTQQHVRLFKAFIYRLFEQIFLMEVHLYKKQLSLVRHLTLCHTSRQRWGILAFSSGFFFSLFKNQFWAFDEHVNGLFFIALRDVHSLLFLLHVQVHLDAIFFLKTVHKRTTSLKAWIVIHDLQLL